MTTYTPISSLPRPGTGDPPNAPAQITELTNSLDTKVVPKFASASSRNATIPAPIAGQLAYLTDSNTLTVYNSAIGQWCNFYSTPGAFAAWAEEGTNIVFTNTSPTAGAPACGTSFVAPPSGNVLMIVTGCIDMSTNTNLALLGYEIRTGSTVGSGTVFLAPDFESRTIAAGRAVNTSAAASFNGSHVRPISGLTAGATYNVRTMHWLLDAGGSATVRHRFIIVLPI